MGKNQALLSALLLMGCANGTTHPLYPATFTEKNPSLQQELKQWITQQLPGQKPKLATYLFLNNHQIFIERTPLRDPGGRLIEGRHQHQAQSFQLVTDGKYCYVQHINSQVSKKLNTKQCKLSD